MLRDMKNGCEVGGVGNCRCKGESWIAEFENAGLDYTTRKERQEAIRDFAIKQVSFKRFIEVAACLGTLYGFLFREFAIGFGMLVFTVVLI